MTPNGNFLKHTLQVEAEDPVELVLVMTVEPGFGGQKFMPEMMEKVIYFYPYFLTYICPS